MAVVNDPHDSQVRQDEKEAHEAKLENIRRLEEIRDNLEHQITTELDFIMQKIVARAIEYCPKASGALASSISLVSGTISSAEFFDSSIYVGSEDIVNPEGVPTSQYAASVHDGHALPNGGFWEGVPFLDMAMADYFEELETCVDRALKELGD